MINENEVISMLENEINEWNEVDDYSTDIETVIYTLNDLIKNIKGMKIDPSKPPVSYFEIKNKKYAIIEV
jgi:hypothetical protein